MTVLYSSNWLFWRWSAATNKTFDLIFEWIFAPLIKLRIGYFSLWLFVCNKAHLTWTWPIWTQLATCGPTFACTFNDNAIIWIVGVIQTNNRICPINQTTSGKGISWHCLEVRKVYKERNCKLILFVWPHTGGFSSSSEEIVKTDRCWAMSSSREIRRTFQELKIYTSKIQNGKISKLNFTCSSFSDIVKVDRWNGLLSSISGSCGRGPTIFFVNTGIDWATTTLGLSMWPLRAKITFSQNFELNYNEKPLAKKNSSSNYLEGPGRSTGTGFRRWFESPTGPSAFTVSWK